MASGAPASAALGPGFQKDNAGVHFFSNSMLFSCAVACGLGIGHTHRAWRALLLARGLALLRKLCCCASLSSLVVSLCSGAGSVRLCSACWRRMQGMAPVLARAYGFGTALRAYLRQQTPQAKKRGPPEATPDPATTPTRPHPMGAPMGASMGPVSGQTPGFSPCGPF